MSKIDLWRETEESFRSLFTELVGNVDDTVIQELVCRAEKWTQAVAEAQKEKCAEIAGNAPWPEWSGEAKMVASKIADEIQNSDILGEWQ